MNVKTAITRKEQESDLPNPGGLCWASVHTYTSQHASSIKAAVPYAGSLVTAGRTGVQQWETNTGKYVLQHKICCRRINGNLVVLHKHGALGVSSRSNHTAHVIPNLAHTVKMTVCWF